jgi:hypothetical protein
MADSEARRKAVFLSGLAVLVAWAAAVALLGTGAEHGKARGGGGAGNGPPRALAGGRGRSPGTPQRSAGARCAVDFLAAYLRYEVGGSSRPDRETLARLSTPRFGVQLRRAPLSAPPAAPGREWISRVEAVRVGIFEGEPALLVSVLVVGPAGGHLLTPTLLERGSRWLVAGLGQ